LIAIGVAISNVLKLQGRAFFVPPILCLILPVLFGVFLGKWESYCNKKYGLWEGKEVTVVWGEHKGKKGRVETVGKDTGTATIKLDDSTELLLYPEYDFYKEPVVFKYGKDNFRPGTKVKIKTLSGKYTRQTGVVCEFNESNYLVGVKLDKNDKIIWFAQFMLDTV
jgi:hypothetical protein